MLWFQNVDSQLPYKASCVVATTANITLSGTQTIDGTNVVAGDRVLVKDQTTPSQNGIYLVAAGAWGRADDADTIAKLSGAMVSVLNTTGNIGVTYRCPMVANGILGTAAINWYQVIDTTSYRVRVVVTNNVTLSSMPVAQDGAILAQLDRVLLVGQTNAAQNGVYTVGIVSAGNAPVTRNITHSTALLVASSGVVEVTEGLFNGGTAWITTFKATDTLDTTAQPWTRIATLDATNKIPVAQIPAITSAMITDGTIVNADLSPATMSFINAMATDVQGSGSNVLSDALAINFTGAGVTATNAGGGVAAVDIPGVPIGGIIRYVGTTTLTPPAGFLHWEGNNGQVASVGSYPTLNFLLGTKYGTQGQLPQIDATPQDMTLTQAQVFASAAAGYSISSFTGRLSAGWASFTVAFTKTAAQALGNPNYSDQLMGTTTTNFAPTVDVGGISVNAPRWYRINTGGQLYTVAGMANASYTLSDIAAGDTMTMSFSYPVDGVNNTMNRVFWLMRAA